MIDGGPAFPCPTGSDGGVAFPGMSMRDWFAGKTLEAFLSNPSECIEFSKLEDHNPDTTPLRVAARCYVFADAMLKERDKPTNQ